jgi:hypothetical protein
MRVSDYARAVRVSGVLVFAACLPVLTGACGGSKPPDSDAGVGGMIGSAAPLVDAFCAAARACCAQAGRSLDTLARCEQSAGASYGAAEVADGAIRVDGPAFDACVAAYQRAATSCAFTEVMTACRGIYIGTLSSGDACKQVADCRRDKGPMICEMIITTPGVNPTTGICKLAPRGKENDPCIGSCPIGGDCSIGLLSGEPNPPLALCHEQDGLFCDSDQTCHRLNPLGAACFYDWGCGTGNYCDQGCARILAAGAACQYNNSCGPGYTCAAGACAPAPLATDGTCEGLPQHPMF